MRLPVAEFPDQVAVDGATQHPPLPEQRLRPRRVGEQPGEFTAREIGVEHQSCLALDGGLGALLPEPFAEIRGAPTLPDDSVIQGLAGLTIPEGGGFPLIGDTDGRNLIGLAVLALHHRADTFEDGGPDFFGVVFYPAGPRIDLREFVVDCGTELAGLIDQGDGATRRALIYRQYKRCHGSGGGVAGYRLDLQVVSEPVFSPLPAVAALLVAAKGHIHAGVGTVQVDVAGSDA